MVKFIAFLLSCTLLVAAEHSKIYDCFLFYNEFEVLEIRLNELYDYVDKFVLVEATETFRGNPKPLYFAKEKERFARFADKIIYVGIEKRVKTDNPWEREEFQRNQIMRGLTECRPRDIVMISDVDEIVHPNRLPMIAHLLQTHSAVGCRQKMYTFYLNRYEKIWEGSAATTYNHLLTISPEILRRKRREIPLLGDAGWHFSYMGGIDKVISKFEAYSHAESDTSEVKNRTRLKREIEEHAFCEIDETYPLFVQQNQGYLKEIGLIHAKTE